MNKDGIVELLALVIFNAGGKIEVTDEVVTKFMQLRSSDHTVKYFENEDDLGISLELVLGVIDE